MSVDTVRKTSDPNGFRLSAVLARTPPDLAGRLRMFAAFALKKIGARELFRRRREHFWLKSTIILVSNIGSENLAFSSLLNMGGPDDIH